MSTKCRSEDFACCFNADLHTYSQVNPCNRYLMKHKIQGIMYLGQEKSQVAKPLRSTSLQKIKFNKKVRIWFLVYFYNKIWFKIFLDIMVEEIERFSYLYFLP